MNLEKIKKESKLAFTLIELLVVITIIGILATGAVSVYTSQIQKARDTTRINDVEALKSGVEQFYQDNSQYPNADNTFTGVITYTPKIPTDPKIGQTCNGGGSASNTPTCTYIYGVSTDNNGIEFGEYEISTAFENSGNRTTKGAKDGGNDDYRYEVGLDVGDTLNHKTDCYGSSKISITKYDDIKSGGTKCSNSSASAVSNGVGSIFIAGN